MQQKYKRTTIPKLDFHKVALQLYWNHTSLWDGCTPVKVLHIFRTPYPKSTYEWLLLRDAPTFMVLWVLRPLHCHIQIKASHKILTLWNHLQPQMARPELFNLESLQKRDTTKVSCSIKFSISERIFESYSLESKRVTNTWGKCNFIEALLFLDILQTKKM